jgi:uncharacterized membrane protein (UPF0127 family)
MRSIVGSLVLALASARCQRPVQEDWSHSAEPPSPAATRSTGVPAIPDEREGSSEASTDDLPSNGRCVLPTPAESPPVPAPSPMADCPLDPEGAGPHTLPTARIGFPDARGTSVVAELVISQHDTMKGLMYRRSLAPDAGMLFDLGVREDHKFWMHNTCIPLDLIYIDFDGLVVGIVESAPTLNDESRGVGCPSRWVLEVNAGWSRRHGVKAGQRVEVPRL